MMRSFILGIIVTIAVTFVGGIVIAQFGLMPTNADATPPAFETRIASRASFAIRVSNAGGVASALVGIKPNWAMTMPPTKVTAIVTMIPSMKERIIPPQAHV